MRTPGEPVFPDYPGNGVYNSLGNVLANPNIGLPFVDFAAQQRLRINERGGDRCRRCAARSVRCA